MLIKSEPAPTNSVPIMPAAASACGNCGAEEGRLLHQIRYRSNFRRVCTTCVLRIHPQAFCPVCFQVYPPSPPKDATRVCSKCYSHSHSQCVGGGGPPPNSYLCPLCVNPNVPVFKLKPAKESNIAAVQAMNARVEDCKVMDRDAAKMLFAAAKIATASMNKAAAATKMEAERKVKEAAFTKRRAKEALEHVAHLVIKEKARRKEAALGAGGPAADVAGRGYGGIVSNGGGYVAPHGRIGAEVNANANVNVNVGATNRNGVIASLPRPLVVVEGNAGKAGNVDRDNSNQVLAALNAVELKENVKIEGGEGSEKVKDQKIEGGEGSEKVTPADDHAPMDVDVDVDVGEGGMVLNAGESTEGMNNDGADMETGAGNVNIQEEKLDAVNNEVVLAQDPAQNKENDNGGGSV